MTENGRRNRDATLMLALAAGRTVRQACKRARVSERTAFRRLADPDFRQRVTEARADMVARALGRLADGATTAVDTLRALLKHAETDSVRLGAARSILELGTRLRESVELEARLSALEQRVKS